MATGVYVLQDGSVMVAYGPRHIPISCAQYKANGYKPALQTLMAKSPGANTSWSLLRSPPRDSGLASQRQAAPRDEARRTGGVR
jgi:hypothetical protein